MLGESALALLPYLGALAVWQGENFLGWHIGSEKHTVLCQGLGANPFVPDGQAECEICFIRFIVQGAKLLGLHVIGAFAQVRGGVTAPSPHRVRKKSSSIGRMAHLPGGETY